MLLPVQHWGQAGTEEVQWNPLVSAWPLSGQSSGQTPRGSEHTWSYSASSRCQGAVHGRILVQSIGSVSFLGLCSYTCQKLFQYIWLHLALVLASSCSGLDEGFLTCISVSILPWDQVPGRPTWLHREYSPLLSPPICAMYNSSIRNSVYCLLCGALPQWCQFRRLTLRGQWKRTCGQSHWLQYWRRSWNALSVNGFVEDSRSYAGWIPVWCHQGLIDSPCASLWMWCMTGLLRLTPRTRRSEPCCLIIARLWT